MRGHVYDVSIPNFKCLTPWFISYCLQTERCTEISLECHILITHYIKDYVKKLRIFQTTVTTQNFRIRGYKWHWFCSHLRNFARSPCRYYSWQWIKKRNSEKASDGMMFIPGSKIILKLVQCLLWEDRCVRIHGCKDTISLSWKCLHIKNHKLQATIILYRNKTILLNREPRHGQSDTKI